MLYIPNFHLFVYIRDILLHLLVCLAKVPYSAAGVENRRMILVAAVSTNDG